MKMLVTGTDRVSLCHYRSDCISAKGKEKDKFQNTIHITCGLVSKLDFNALLVDVISASICLKKVG